MLHELTHSLIAHLRQLPQLKDVVWMYDGVELTSRSKPFATVEQLPVNSMNLSKDRIYYEDNYHFQVGLFANNTSERSRLVNVIQNQLRKKVTLYDTSEATPKPSGVFYCEVEDWTPLTADETESDTYRHRGYFDVTVVVDTKLNEE